jgi:hypothetical protein
VDLVGNSLSPPASTVPCGSLGKSADPRHFFFFFFFDERQKRHKNNGCNDNTNQN